MTSERQIADDLRALTRALVERGHPTSGGLLGGEYGYGAYFENDTFTMHPYCWCEQDTCPWCNVCLCDEGATVYLLDGKPTDDWDAWLDAPDSRRSTHTDETKQCARCRTGQEAAPNFLHKPSGTTVHWYKYIGRGMEVDLRGNWNEHLAQCLATIPPTNPASDPQQGAPSS